MLQVIGIPIEMDTATAKARTNRMGAATSSTIVPKPILRYKEDTLCTTSTFYACTCVRKMAEPS